MKKFLITLVAITSLIACKSKDDNDAPNQLIGGWKLESITEGNELQKLTECDKNVIIYSATETEEIFFKEDSNGNCVYNKDTSIEKRPYRVRGNIVTATNPAIQQDYPAEFAIEGSKVTFKVKVTTQSRKTNRVLVFRKLSPQELTEIEKLKNLKP